MFRPVAAALLAFLLAGSASAEQPDTTDSATAVGSLEASDDRVPADFWVAARPEFGLIGMTGPVLLNRAEIGGGGRMGSFRAWGFLDAGTLHSLGPDASTVPSVVLEGGMGIAGARALRRGEWFLGPRFSFGGLDFDLTFATLGATGGFVLGRWDRKAWLRLGLDVVAVFPWRLPDYTTLGIALSAGVQVR